MSESMVAGLVLGQLLVAFGVVYIALRRRIAALSRARLERQWEGRGLSPHVQSPRSHLIGGLVCVAAGGVVLVGTLVGWLG